MKLSNRVLKMEESVTLATAARAKALKAQGRDILSLTLGEPDFPTPKNIRDAAVAAIEDGRASFYTVTSGLPELKEAVVEYFANYYGYTIQPNQVTVATGAKFSLYTFFMSVLDPGDEAIIPTPYWVSYGDQIKMAEGTPVFVQATEENNFKVTVEQLEAARTDKTKVLILADDIYGRLVYNGNKFTPISSLSEEIRKQTVVINGVSKSYSMTGWRIGYAVGEPEIIAAMSKIAGQTTSNPTAAAQYAAIEALTGSQETVETMRQAFEERLNTIYPLLAQVPGFEVVKPQGAFYLFPNVKKAMEMKGYTDVTEFTTAILEEVGVALVTGAGFGAPENVRLSYATDLETLKEAVGRLQQFMESK